MRQQLAAEAPKSFGQRIMSWVGRTHPFAVRFTIALYPVALMLARRRGETVELIRSLIAVAGGASVIAGALGWLTGGFALSQDDALHFWHRWLGTGLALAGGMISIWAHRRRESVFSSGMTMVLGAITLILLVQGWLGAALGHGTDHTDF
jgi:heme A synthase